jgi:hypothetical protein
VWDLAACPDIRRHRAFVIVEAGILRGTFPNTRPDEGGIVAAEPVFFELSGEDAG